MKFRKLFTDVLVKLKIVKHVDDFNEKEKEYYIVEHKYGVVRNVGAVVITSIIAALLKIDLQKIVSLEGALIIIILVVVNWILLKLTIKWERIKKHSIS